MPDWLGTIARLNPLSATAPAVRELFLNPGWQGNTWLDQNALLLAIFWPALLIAIFLPLSVHKYRRLNQS